MALVQLHNMVRYLKVQCHTLGQVLGQEQEALAN